MPPPFLSMPLSTAVTKIHTTQFLDYSPHIAPVSYIMWNVLGLPPLQVFHACLYNSTAQTKGTLNTSNVPFFTDIHKCKYNIHLSIIEIYVDLHIYLSHICRHKNANSRLLGK